MQIKTVKEIIERRIYLAEDGTEFSSPVACQEHEMIAERQKAEKIVAALKRFEGSPDLDRSDSAWDWYFVSDQEELDAVRTHLFDLDSTAFDYKAPSFPCWIACVYDDDGMGSIAGTFEEVVDMMRGFEQAVAEAIKKAEAKE